MRQAWGAQGPRRPAHVSVISLTTERVAGICIHPTALPLPRTTSCLRVLPVRALYKLLGQLRLVPCSPLTIRDRACESTMAEISTLSWSSLRALFSAQGAYQVGFAWLFGMSTYYLTVFECCGTNTSRAALWVTFIGGMHPLCTSFDRSEAWS